MKLKLNAFAAALVAVMALSAGAQASEYTIAIVQALTGPAATVGGPVKNGALLALEELNKKNFFGEGVTVKATVNDDGGDRAQAITLINRYAADPSVLMIMGPTAGSSADAGASAAVDQKIPIMTTTNSLEVLKAGAAGNNTFILTQPQPVAVPYIARYAIDTLKVKNCAVIGMSDIESMAVMQRMFSDYLAQHGAKVSDTESIKVSDSDFTAMATKVAALNDIDCVFVSSYAPQGANVIVQLRQAGLDKRVRIIGQNAMASPDFVNKGGPAVEGIYLMAEWVPGGVNDDGRAFIEAFKAKNGSPPDNWAAVGYSGMRVLATAIKNAGPNPTREKVREAMTRTKDVPVVVGQGLYSVDDKRWPHFGMSILTIKDGKFVPAPG